MAQIINNTYIQVFKVQYTYDDVELHKSVTLVELVPDFHSVIEYLNTIEEDCKIMDNEFYKCRSNIRIKIVPDLISEKKYVQLFKK